MRPLMFYAAGDKPNNVEIKAGDESEMQNNLEH